LQKGPVEVESVKSASASQEAATERLNKIMNTSERLAFDCSRLKEYVDPATQRRQLAVTLALRFSEHLDMGTLAQEKAAGG
jgi:hypothetical protein